MNNQTFYISGKISGVPDLNRPKFEFTKRRLCFIHGVDTLVFNPHDLPVNHDGSWASYMKTCIRYLTRASVVVVLDDWQNSRGAIIEVLLAWVLAIPVTELQGYECITVKITVRLRIKLLFKLFLNRFANAADYQPK